ncbi:pyridoxine 5'-phosphate synthase [Arcobacter sp. FWKO B]|uniref:pyridoxine 5'-phosphate synthase n=1 Tax=Arcobacter sp. FWKO B TaxID=2593672 RepID=UPI0018A4088E|nr:pyridoxine 5'-phosphate synthase [Arcobacter sp. FWKO B]QOG11520.1 pyridoxine 5'-phosphate synthase [Arcobacter sp. FWKO B]
MKLGVNIDHIAVLREARKINDPSPLDAVGVCRLAGADQITIHLREDRRHIHDNDARDIINSSLLPVNLECSINPDIIDIVCALKPYRATLVPENRNEVTTEGGLDLAGNYEKIKKAIDKLKANEIEVSLFIDPSLEACNYSRMLDSDWVEFHTGSFANIYAMLYTNLRLTHHCIKELDLPRAKLHQMLDSSLEDLNIASKEAYNLGLRVAAGHGLNYNNVTEILHIKEITELNIGQSIVARSVYVGLESAIKEMILKVNK